MKNFNKRNILIHLLGFAISRAIFFDMNPLAIGYFMAAYLNNAGKALAFFVAFLGIASVMEPTQILKYSLIMLTTLVLMEAPVIKNHRVPKKTLYAITSVTLCIFSLLEITEEVSLGDYILMAVLEAIIALVAAEMFKLGMEYIIQASKDFKMTNEQMISIAVMVAIAIYSFPDFQNQYFDPLKTLVYFLVLYFTYKYGVGQGAITGAVCGFSLGLKGGSVTDIGIYTILGVLPAVFREMGRFPTAIMYLITAGLMGTLNNELELTLQEIGAVTSAVVIFLLLPPGAINRIDAIGAMGRQEQLAAQNLKKIAEARMKIFSNAFLKLSKTLDTISDKQAKLRQQEINRIFEDISEKLCRNCDNCSSCWSHKLQKTYEAACAMFEVAEQKGNISKEDVPPEFLDDCICVDEFIAETNRGFEIAKLNQIWHNRISESREVIAEQLKEVSAVIQNITGDIYERVQGYRTEEEKVIRALKAEHILVKEITIFERGDKRREIYLSAACKGGRCITAKEAACIISHALDAKIKVSEASKAVISKDYDNFSFITDTNFKVLTGVARAMKENISGDNFSLLKLETGEFMMALSDGMGTGKDASDESETVMSLLEEMIEAGFSAKTAIKLINSSLVLKADKQTFTTIDLSIINLFTGMCEFIKLGAAAAFIKRDHWVETISSTTLPIGMFGNVDYDTVTKKLYEGDIIILVTDGVLDCIDEVNKEQYMEQLIMEIKSNNPQEIANRILDKMLSRTNYVPRDDMTILTAGLWLK